MSNWAELWVLTAPLLESASGRATAASHPPVHSELPVLLHSHRYPVQGPCVVGWVNGPQREHAPLAIPETEERHVIAP